MQKQFVPISKYTYTFKLPHYLCGGAGNEIWIW